MDQNNIYRIGIDKISLYNFSVDMGENVKKIIENKANCVKEKAIVEDEFFSIINSYVIYQNELGIGENLHSRITFNPNKLIYGSNVCNSNIPDLRIAMEKLNKILKEKGIKVDFSEAKIADIELNINMPVNFQNYYEIFMLFIKQFTHSKSISSIIDAEKVNDFKADESFYCPISKNLSFKIYDKTIEKKLNYPVTRMEYSFELTTYKYITEKYGLDNSLQTLLSNLQLPEKIFKERIQKDFTSKFDKYLLKRKELLEREYLAFKKSNELARKVGRKEERDVYKYLEQFWIFDYNFLNEIVVKHDKKHKGRELERIKKKYSMHNNLEKLEKVWDFIFN